MNITESIQSDLRALLAADKLPPCALTLAGLSKHYNVSSMPVRNAVDVLVAEGLLVRSKNGRLSASHAPRKAKPSSISAAKRSLSSTTTSHTKTIELALRNQVIRRCLMQNTEYLREEATAGELKVGRTVVRQVFSQLAGEGLLEHIPRCGWRVFPFSESDMRQYLVVRELMELKALDLARPNFDKAELELLLKANQPGASKSRSKLDLTLHNYWIARCDNLYIQTFFNRYGPFYDALFNYAVVDNEVKSVMAGEHAAIIECLLAKQWQGARKALSHHIRDQEGALANAIALLHATRK